MQVSDVLAEVPRQEQPTASREPHNPFLISWSLSSPDLESILDETSMCERSRLDGVWFPDYEAPLAKWPELYVVLSAIAARTRTLRIGSLVTDVVRRHPLVTAHAFASLSHMAPGRVNLGLGAGAGTSQYPFGISLGNSVSRLAEGIRVIRALWGAREGEVDFSGRYFSLKSAQPPMFPMAEVPIYLASYGPKMIELTAELADGWLPESHTPETYKKTLSEIHEKMKHFGRDPNAFHGCCASIFYPWEPDEKAFTRILQASKRYLADYPDIQWAAGAGKDHPSLRTHQIEQDPALLESLVAKVPDSLAEATLVYGSVSQCYEKLSRMRDGGCAESILEPYWIEGERILDGIESAGWIKRVFAEEH